VNSLKVCVLFNGRKGYRLACSLPDVILDPDVPGSQIYQCDNIQCRCKQGEILCGKDGGIGKCA
jgi:hypothetical protein